MIKISLNGEQLSFDEAPTLAQLIESQNIPLYFIAVERNGELVEGDPKKCVLEDGDTLEIARFVGGG